MGRAKNAPPSMVDFGGTDSWCSPAPVRDGIYDLFDGPPHTDPCTNDHSIIAAVVKYTRMGTHRPWIKTAYENPPFSKTAAFTSHGLDELHDERLKELVRLVMFAPSTAWWLEMCGVYVKGVSPVHRMNERTKWTGKLPNMKSRFVISDKCPNPEIIATKRLAFIGDKDMGARFDTALVYFGHRKQRFLRAFKHITRWTTRGRL